MGKLKHYWNNFKYYTGNAWTVIKAIFIVAVTLMLVGGLPGEIDSVIGKIAAVLVTLLVGAIALYFFVIAGTRCPNCGKMLCLKHVDTKVVGKSDISVKVETKRKNSNGDVVGSDEQYVPGTRTTYRRVFVCTKCGKECYRDVTEDKADI